MSAKPIMLQGTGSDVGKSVLSAALCRIFLQDGYSVAPFKSQNMALNSFVTEDGGEMGRAQVVQAQACRLKPSVLMNPILLKPVTDVGAQVIVKGKPIGNMSVEEYFDFKLSEAIPMVKACYDELAAEYDIIVIEGAGSPAEINLRDSDIVNMRMAELVDSPVILIGDIDKGGVFASLVGTLVLLEPHESERIKGFLINKFRGRKSLLDSGLRMIEQRCGKPFLGVIPFFKDIKIPDEDSVALKQKKTDNFTADTVNIEVLLLPHISNFTDFDPFEEEPDVRLRYVPPTDEISNPDVLIIPGSKNTMGDLRWLKAAGHAKRIAELAAEGKTIIGICGGYQMLGKTVRDATGVESEAGAVDGLGLLDVETIFKPQKQTFQVEAVELETKLQVRGYEIHQGETRLSSRALPLFKIQLRGSKPTEITDGAKNPSKNIWGTYIHGIFDADEYRRTFIDQQRIKKGMPPLEKIQYRYNQDAEYDKLADVVRENIQLDLIYDVLFYQSHLPSG